MIDYLILTLLLVVVVILFCLGRSYATINTTDLIMTREEFRDKKSKDYRKRRESYGIKDPVYLDEIEEAYYQGMVDADAHPHWISIDDELPPCNVFVLTCDGQENTNLLMLAGDGRWYDKAVGLHRNITHWMPLPQAPHHFADVSQKVKKGGKQ